MARAVVFPVLIVALAMVGACSGKDEGQPPGYQPDTTPVSQLDGDAASRAVDRTSNVNAITGTALADIVTDPATGVEWATTSFQVRLAEGATVGDVNEMLASLDGEIVSMFEGQPFLLVRIANPGGLSEYQASLAELEAKAFAEHVSPGYFPQVRELPPNHALGSGDTDMIGHHLAVRAHAAWHVRHLADVSVFPPHLIIADAFGAGPPDATYFNIASLNPDHYKGTNPRDHGYGVLGVILAKFGADSTERGLQTGIYPSSLSISAFDISGLTLSAMTLRPDFNMIEDSIIHLVKGRLGEPAVVNTSLGFPCDNVLAAATFCVDEFAREEGFDWLSKVRGLGLEGEFIHVTAAGNIASAVASNTEAKYDSPFAAARLIDDFTTAGGTPITPLENTRVVEGMLRSDSALFVPLCLSEDSKYDGDIAAISHQVSSVALVSSSNPAGTKTYSGTSFAAPQVAGAAAYVWALDPSLAVLDVLQRLDRTTHGSISGSAAGCSSTLSARVLDVYHAVLSVDSALSTTLAPVRHELLDVADGAGAPGRNDRFDEKDLKLFTSMFELQRGTLDYSRYDLNGDAHTGGSSAESFDLDLDLLFGTTQQQVENATVDFNENAVSDLEVLCYYAYSPLYAGSDTDRRELLEEQCQGVPTRCEYVDASSGDDRDYSKTCFVGEQIVFDIHQVYDRQDGYERTQVADVNSFTEWQILRPEDPPLPDCSIWAVGELVVTWAGPDLGSVQGSTQFAWNDRLQPDYYLVYGDPGTQVECWPDYDPFPPGGGLPECGAYACPSSITPLHAYPGNCHQWWDHFDEDGVWVQCTP